MFRKSALTPRSPLLLLPVPSCLRHATKQGCVGRMPGENRGGAPEALGLLRLLSPCFFLALGQGPGLFTRLF